MRRVVSILPVWVLLCPRDYLSSYMKVGVIVLLAVGIFVAHPSMKMPAVTRFSHGGGPISGSVWPFVCIVIACGALSGFHALVASGTTPKMVNKESDIRPIGYGGMLLEGFVSLHGPDCRLRLGAGRLFHDQHRKDQIRGFVEETQAKYGWDLKPVEIRQTQSRSRREGRTVGPHGRGRDARPGHGENPRRSARHEGD